MAPVRRFPRKRSFFGYGQSDAAGRGVLIKECPGRLFTITAAAAVASSTTGVLAAVADNAATQTIYAYPGDKNHFRSATAPRGGSAPVLIHTPAATGLSAGTYLLAYSFIDSNGDQGQASPQGSVTIAAGDNIGLPDVRDGQGNLPAGAVSVNWFISSAVNGTSLTQLSTAGTGAPATITALPTAHLFTDPAAARNLTATPGGTTANVTAVQVIVNGKDLNGSNITETLPAFSAGAATTKAGAKAFKYICKVVIPANGTAVTTALGWGNILGLPDRMSLNLVTKAFLNKVLEGTAPTVTVDAANLCNNTALLNSALNGTQVDIKYDLDVLS